MEHTEDNVTLEDFYRYFARWEEAYPGGIPLEYIESPKALFLINNSEVVDEKKIQDLFTAIVKKGLQWKKGEAQLVIVDESTIDTQALTTRYGEMWWVLAGTFSELFIDTVKEHVSEEMIVRTSSLAKVLVDTDEKKRLWKDIQKLL